MVKETRVKNTTYSYLATVMNADGVSIDQLQFRHCKQGHKGKGTVHPVTGYECPEME
jgi:hypothetical protein